MIAKSDKLYVQLAPDSSGLQQLSGLQRGLGLKKEYRPVAASQLHLTILHIGLVERLLESLKGHTNLEQPAILSNLSQLVTDLQSITTGQPGFNNLDLQPQAFTQFGRQAQTLVLTYDTPATLQALHTQSLNVLQTCLGNCGIQDVAGFMRQDSNLQYALSLRPHVALAKSYTAAVNLALPPPMTFGLMKIVY